MRVGILGIGKWGKNLVREFDEVCDIAVCSSRGNKENIRWMKENYPHIKVVSYGEMLEDKSIDAVVVATPIDTHFDATKRALGAGKHVFVEKPIANNVGDAKILVKTAEKKGLVLFVGHVFLYHQVLQKIKDIVKVNRILQIRFSWNKLGTFDEDIVWNLLVHDVSIAIDLLGKPKKISVIEEMGFLTKTDVISIGLEFAREECTININRTANCRSKTVTIATKNRLLLWEDDSLYEFNKKAGSFRLLYRSKRQPLAIECEEFVKRIKMAKKKPQGNGRFAIDVVKVIDRVDKLRKS